MSREEIIEMLREGLSLRIEIGDDWPGGQRLRVALMFENEEVASDYVYIGERH